MVFIKICIFVIFSGIAFAEEPKDADCDMVIPIKKKDGYIVFDQTELSSKGKKQLVNHAVSLASSVASSVKIIKFKCTPFAPSFYLYNSANIVDMMATYNALDKQNRESEEVLEVFIGSDQKSDKTPEEKTSERNDIIGKQISTLDAAYEQQMKAYEAAKKREKILKITGQLRLTAVGLAGVETALLFTPAGASTVLFKCVPRVPAMPASTNNLSNASADASDSASADASDSDSADASDSDSGGAVWTRLRNIQTQHNNKWIPKPFSLTNNPISKNFNTTLMNTGLKVVLGKWFGETTPVQRIIFYGAGEILALTMAEDVSKTAECMKKRADEFKRVAAILRARIGTTPNGDTKREKPTEEVKIVSTTTKDTDLFDRNDFGGCIALDSSKRLINDPQCRCKETNSCYQIPKNTLPKTNKAKQGSIIGSPSDFAISSDDARDFVNGVFSGDNKKLNLAANRLGQGAKKLRKRINTLQKAINQDRKKINLPPINFDSGSRQLVKEMQDAMGEDLQNIPIKRTGRGYKNPSYHPIKTNILDSGSRQGHNIQTTPLGYSERSPSLINKPKKKSADKVVKNIYDTRGKDISGFQKKDIFKIITLRYQQTGYPLLLKRKVEKK